MKKGYIIAAAIVDIALLVVIIIGVSRGQTEKDETESAPMTSAVSVISEEEGQYG